MRLEMKMIRINWEKGHNVILFFFNFQELSQQNDFFFLSFLVSLEVFLEIMVILIISTTGGSFIINLIFMNDIIISCKILPELLIIGSFAKKTLK
jgi:hypothetical protein